MERIIKLVRYRFFLFAGIFPYLLGQAMAFSEREGVKGTYFFMGLAGIFLVLSGVELFNEYFDFKEGGDRIFSKELPYIPAYFFRLGILAFFFAFLIGIYFTFKCGWPILLFSFLGFLSAYFYVGPPLRWAYRGLGEIVIGLSYGPFMTLGSYYIQANRISLVPVFVSLISGLAMFSLAIANEIPDYYQDKLVSKRNLVVRLGKRKAVWLIGSSWISAFFFLSLGVWLKKIPHISLFAFCVLPFIIHTLSLAGNDLDKPHSIIPAIRVSLFSYIVLTGCLGAGYLGR